MQRVVKLLGLLGLLTSSAIGIPVFKTEFNDFFKTEFNESAPVDNAQPFRRRLDRFFILLKKNADDFYDG